MEHYIYVYLDPRKIGNYIYGDLKFEYEPFYLGISKNDARMDSHLEDAKKYLETKVRHRRFRNNRKIFKICKIIKDGYEPIRQILVSNISECDAYKLETEYIFTIGRARFKTGPLLNYLPGGQIINGDLISLKLRNNVTLNQFRNKEVLQYDLSGNLINTWKSVRSIKNVLGLSHVAACCRGERKTAGGFIWKFATEIVQTKRKYKQRKTNRVVNRVAVEQCDKNGIKMNEYLSTTDASIITNISRRSISNNLTGSSKSAGGFIWKYKK